MRLMRVKILSKQALIAAALSGLVVFAALFLYFFPKAPTQGGFAVIAENSAVLSNQKQASIGQPVVFKIPIINVDADVEYVGLTSDGAMDIPKKPDEVAWFSLGQRPGEKGTAVIAGHYGWKNNIPAVFDNLHKLRIGDRISVEDDNGVNVTFVVREIRIYDKDASVAEVFSSTDGKSHLNLITCTGDWNKDQESYSDRLVVFTDKQIEK